MGSRENLSFRCPILKLLTKLKNYWLQLLLVGLATISLTSQFFGIRPIQDDYFILGAVSTDSIFSLLTSVWGQQGGNLVPYAFSAWAASFTSTSLTYWPQKAFLVGTVILILLLSSLLVKWLGIADRRLKIALTMLLLLSFEGIFTPLQIAAYSWAQTSLTHLWPILITLIVLFSFEKTKFTIPLYFLAGVVVGNSNIAESLWGIFSVFLYAAVFMKFGRPFLINSRILKLFGFIVGAVIGFCFIIIAPGFWNRANVSVGFPSSLEELIERFAKSLGAFGFDIISHPYLFMALLIGCLTLGGIAPVIQDLERKLLFLGVSSILLFVLLVVGTTAGYPAWHQSLGLFPILTLAMFLLGVKVRLRIRSHGVLIAKVLFSTLLVLCLTITLRTSMAVSQRATSWNSDFQRNYCLIINNLEKSSNELELSGPEIIYPLFRKGIEDIHSWDWMKSGYIKWVESGKIQSTPDCGINQVP